jgi:amicyanin
MKVPADQLATVLGITHVNFVPGHHELAVVDSTLASAGTSRTSADERPDKVEVRIDNFSFAPKILTVKPGATITWTNRDDIPHNVVSTGGSFASPVLDTDQTFTFEFRKPGTYPYFCKIHPMMTGSVIVEPSSTEKT